MSGGRGWQNRSRRRRISRTRGSRKPQTPSLAHDPQQQARGHDFLDYQSRIGAGSSDASLLMSPDQVIELSKIPDPFGVLLLLFPKEDRQVYVFFPFGIAAGRSEAVPL